LFGALVNRNPVSFAISSTAFSVQPPDLRSAPLMDTDFAV
jgi:hypothetical protein